MKTVTCSKCNTNTSYGKEIIVGNWSVCIECRSIINVDNGEQITDDEWLELELDQRKEINYLLTLADKEKAQKLIHEIHGEIEFFKKLIQSNIQAVPIDNMTVDMFEYFILVRQNLSNHNRHLFCSVLGMLEYFKEIQESHKKFKEIVDNPKFKDILDSTKFEEITKEILEKISLVQ